MKQISKEIVRELLLYDIHTGNLLWKIRARKHFKTESRWKSWNKTVAGTVAGTARKLPSGDSHIQITIFGNRYFAHRLVWIYFNGDIHGSIDHINGNGTDNRIDNLRVVDPKNNYKNMRIPHWNTSGVVGIVWHKRYKTWQAYIRSDNKRIHLGSFKNKEDAISARKSAEKEYGFHNNHGNFKRGEVI